MKTTLLKNGLYFFSLLLLVIPSIQAGTEEAENTPALQDNTQEPAPKPKFVAEFESPTEFMQAFLDPSKKPEKSFIWWAAQMIVMCQKEPKLKKFSALLAQAAKGNPDEPKVNRANAVSKLFIQYQMYFSPELQSYILKTGLQKVLKAMQKRAEK